MSAEYQSARADDRRRRRVLALAPQVEPASFISCFGSSACLQSLSRVLCKTAYGLESPQDRLGSTHTEGAGHPDKLTVRVF